MATDPSPNLENHRAFESLATPDAGTEGSPLGSARALAGFPMRDPEEGYWRLYANLGLDNYLRIREDDIVGTQSLATDEQPLRRTTLWVKPDARLVHTRINSEEIQASFLSGGKSTASLIDFAKNADVRKLVEGASGASGLAGFGARSSLPTEVGDVEELSPTIIASIMYCPSVVAASYAWCTG